MHGSVTVDWTLQRIAVAETGPEGQRSAQVALRVYDLADGEEVFAWDIPRERLASDDIKLHLVWENTLFVELPQTDGQGLYLVMLPNSQPAPQEPDTEMPVEEPDLDNPVNEPVGEPADEPVDEPVDEPADEPAEEPIEEPVEDCFLTAKVELLDGGNYKVKFSMPLEKIGYNPEKGILFNASILFCSIA